MRPLLFACLLAILSTPFAANAADRPNILYIMSDDHAAHGIGAYNSRLSKLNPTPTIDKLAAEGMLFENAFCTNAICSPSRACVITGQYDHTNGSFDLSGKIPTAQQYLPTEMKKLGYQTAMVGKWHLKEEPGAFDFYTVLPGQGDYYNPTFRVRGEKGWGKDTIKFEDSHSSDAITDISLDWLKEGWDQEKPFFLMHHYKAPHDYFENAKRYDEYLADIDIPEPDSLWTLPDTFGSIATRGYDDELLPHIGTSIGNRNPRRSYAIDLPREFPGEYPADYDPSKLSDEQIKRMAYNVYLKKFLRCVKGIDDNLARLFAHLESIGQLDNTVIVYTGDQGFMLGEHDYQDKRWMYEESMRMPFIIRYPKTIKAGQRVDTIVENVDYAPTLLDFAGADQTPEYMQGGSFKELCETGAEPEGWKQEAYYRYWMHMAHHDNPGHMGIRTKTHKLIYYYGCNYEGGYRTPPGWELYDLENDPKELVNLYDDPANADTVTDLKKRLAALRTRVGDDGSHFPKAEAVVQEFWDYDGADKAKAIEISAEFLQRRKAELEANKLNEGGRLQHTGPED